MNVFFLFFLFTITVQSSLVIIKCIIQCLHKIVYELLRHPNVDMTDKNSKTSFSNDRYGNAHYSGDQMLEANLMIKPEKTAICYMCVV